ncbi:hypothetical protein FJ967_16000 [Mesorhizobium sp. B2-3-4]|nr:hypothetical protein FJ967_16000 [Mesorhizobium sp. B2-3-4]
MPNSSTSAAGTQWTSAEHRPEKAYRPSVLCRECGFAGNRREIMNNIIWLVGAVVIVIAILSFFGLR